MNLPNEYVARMEQQLGEEFPKFADSYLQERTYGLRRNPLKIEKAAFENLMDAQGFHLEKVEWAKEGYYYPGREQPGKHPLHEAGCYYIQEPSAMAVAELLDPQPGERICDLCAAPGGKSTQIGGRMQGQGVLVANEVIASRAKILSQNIERMGITNAIVCNETPARLSDFFSGYFDRIVVDAPCSGEGMFRKDENARAEWSPEQVEACAVRQKEILACAVSMLKPNGVLVYSTCTFSEQENEENAKWLKEHYPGLLLEKEMKFLPHLQRGEGHYAVRFRAAGMGIQQTDASSFSSNPISKKGKKMKSSNRSIQKEEAWELFWQFASEVMSEELLQQFQQAFWEGRAVLFGEQLYVMPKGFFASMLSGLKVERVGLQLGICKKKRFEPSHALAMALSPNQVKRPVALVQPERYLCGETMETEETNGWVLVTAYGQPLGWGKIARGILKNHYPKGLRKSR